MRETADPDGRRVILTSARWGHIVRRHAVLERHLEDLLRAVSEPDRRMPGRRDDEEYFYLSGVGPSRWVKVVVHYEHDLGRIVTAFPRRRFP
jgi:hypothetical protein